MKRKIKELGSNLKEFIVENSPGSVWTIMALLIFAIFIFMDIRTTTKYGYKLAVSIPTEERVELTEKLADIKWIHRIGLIDDEELATLSEEISECRYSKQVLAIIDQTLAGLDTTWRDNSDSLSHLIDSH